MFNILSLILLFKFFNHLPNNKLCWNEWSHFTKLIESIRWGNFTKYLFLEVWSPGKSYVFLQNFDKALLENLICSYGISFSWKILCILTKFWTRSPGKFWYVLMIFLSPGKSYVFLRNFEKALLEILMCSGIFCLSWKIYMCSCTIFGSPRKFDVFL